MQWTDAADGGCEGGLDFAPMASQLRARRDTTQVMLGVSLRARWDTCEENEMVLPRAHQPPQTVKDNRWTSPRVTAWRPYDKKRRQGIPAKRWRDDMDKYWRDTIWQRTRQANLEAACWGLRPTTEHYGWQWLFCHQNNCPPVATEIVRVTSLVDMLICHLYLVRLGGA